MKVLIVCRRKEGFPDNVAPFVKEQIDALKKSGISCEYFTVAASGILGYIKSSPALIGKIIQFKPDIVHAHYGLCGLMANFQRQVPVVTTYHGSDINNRKSRFFSEISVHLSAWNIFVSKRTLNLAKPTRNFSLIPCGINLEDYPVIDKQEARKLMGLDSNKKYVLFASSFDNKVKNSELAKAAITAVPDAELLELKGYSRKEVATLMNAVDCLLMTSHTEGSPQVIKEALACGCPIVSVDVGDVKDITQGINGCYICLPDKNIIAEEIIKAFKYERNNGRSIMNDYDNSIVCKKIISVYKKTLCQ